MDARKQKKLEPRIIDAQADLLFALKTMDRLDAKLLVVQADDRYHSLVSVGDIQRAIIANFPLDTSVGDIIRNNNRVARIHDGLDQVRKMIEFRTEFMPVLDESGDLCDVFFWDELFSDHGIKTKQIDVPVVVMAGGKGTRLKPFSNVLPKPLFPLGEKTILETIIDRFRSAGCQRYFLSLNYKADLIRSYLAQASGLPNGIEIFEEQTPMGTAGSLQMIQNQIKETFFVTNCDIIVETDYSEFLDFHKEQKNEISLIAALKHLKIPYGTLESGDGGQLLSLREKPEFTHLVNAGLYILEPHLLSDIPTDRPYQITELIEAVSGRGGNEPEFFPLARKAGAILVSGMNMGKRCG